MTQCGLDLYGSRQAPVESSCEHGNEIFSLIESREVLSACWVTAFEEALCSMKLISYWRSLLSRVGEFDVLLSYIYMASDV
jgi:hypothetical protein